MLTQLTIIAIFVIQALAVPPKITIPVANPEFNELQKLNAWFDTHREQKISCCQMNVPNCAFHMTHTLTDVFAKFYIEALIKCDGNGVSNFTECCQGKGIKDNDCLGFCDIGQLSAQLSTPDEIEKRRQSGGRCFMHGEAIAACINPEYSEAVKKFNKLLDAYNHKYKILPFLRKNYNFFGLI